MAVAAENRRATAGTATGVKTMFTDWPPVLGREDFNWAVSELHTVLDPLPPKLLVDSLLLVWVHMYGKVTTFRVGQCGFVGGVLRIHQSGHDVIYKVTGWEHSIGALYCEWPD